MEISFGIFLQKPKPVFPISYYFFSSYVSFQIKASRNLEKVIFSLCFASLTFFFTSHSPVSLLSEKTTKFFASFRFVRNTLA